MSGEGPNFPPLFDGAAVAEDPFAAAAAEAAQGCDAGLILWRLSADRLEAAMVLAPEVPLAQAAQMHVVGGIGLTNAFGALAPPEVGMQLHWDGRIVVNGAGCGGLQMAASTNDPGAEPDWLVIGFWLPLMPASMEAPGETPDQTSLFEEGCAELDPVHLLEAWARHTLVWLNRWEEEGAAPVHAEWKGLALDLGEEITAPGGLRGRFLGVDEDFTMLLKVGADTKPIPLTALIKDPRPS